MYVVVRVLEKDISHFWYMLMCSGGVRRRRRRISNKERKACVGDTICMYAGVDGGTSGVR